jgi:hypothetical protein
MSVLTPRRGAGLFANGRWTDAKSVAVAIAIALALVTVGGVAQARALTVRRRSALAEGAPTALFIRIHRQAAPRSFVRRSAF